MHLSRTTACPCQSSWSCGGQQIVKNALGAQFCAHVSLLLIARSSACSLCFMCAAASPAQHADVEAPTYSSGRMIAHEDVKERLVEPADDSLVHFVSHEWIGFQHPDPWSTQLRRMQHIFMKFAAGDPLDAIKMSSLELARALRFGSHWSEP
eukprot:5345497-Amphidinium_carterae.1